MTAAERLAQLAGTTGTAAALLLAIGVGATTGEALNKYSSIDEGTAAEHLLSQGAGNLQPAGHLKHLFKSLAAAESPTVTARLRTSWNIKFPHAVEKIVIAAEGQVVTGKLVSRYSVLDPYFGVSTPSCVVKTTTKNVVETPTTGCTTPFLSARTYVTNGAAPPIGAAFAPAVSLKVWATGWPDAPDTVQNPTEEMLLALW